MKKSLIALAVAALLSACSTAPAVPLQATASSSVTGFATLALWGTWESELAPAYTRLAVLRHRAARALQDGRIAVATAIEIQASADQARAKLDASRRGHATEPTADQRMLLVEARHLIYRAEQRLENNQ
jgi:hypothetical protein